MAQLLTAPLTAKQIHAKHGVRESYTDFWNSIKFRKGWESPHIQLSEVEHLLDSAAEIVVRIRSLLDSENPGFKMRMVDGSGREFLWTCEHEQDCPHKEPKQFVRDLVHATFKDANGYVEGLSEEQVDEYMDIIQKSKDSEKSEYQDKILSNLKESWKTTKDLMEEFLDSEIIKDRSNLSWDQVEVIGKGLQRLSENVNEIMGKTQEMETSEVELPSDDEQSESELETPEDGSISEESYSQELELRDPQDLVEEITQNLTANNEDEPSKVEIEEMKDEAKDDQMEETKEDKMEEMKDEVKEDKMEETKEDQVEEEKQTEEEKEEEEKRRQEEEQRKEEERQQEKRDNEAASKIQVIAEDVNQLRPGIRSLQEEADNMIPQNLLKSPKASEEALQKLQKKCIYYSEGLMNHLLTLDAVVTSQKSRPLRKEQVNTIQSMMEDIDKIRKKLREFQQTVEPEAEKERKKEEEERKVKEEEERKKKEEEELKLKEERERKRQEEQQRRKEQMEVEEDEEEEEDEEDDDEERSLQEQKKQRRETELSRSHQHDAGLNWSLLKFEPKMEVSEAHDKYVIASFIPGMRKEDIKIQLSKDQQNVTVEGIREPSPKELNQMKRLVLNRIQQDPRYQSGIRKNDMQAMILRAGSGRFGKFSETYRLPSSVDVQNISARYERGVLEVDIPKIVRRRRQMEPRSPFGRGGRTPSGFFGDNDFWW